MHRIKYIFREKSRLRPRSINIMTCEAALAGRSAAKGRGPVGEGVDWRNPAVRPWSREALYSFNTAGEILESPLQGTSTFEKEGCP